jgi:hypothetical protein
MINQINIFKKDLIMSRWNKVYKRHIYSSIDRVRWIYDIKINVKKRMTFDLFLNVLLLIE